MFEWEKFKEKPSHYDQNTSGFRVLFYFNVQNNPEWTPWGTPNISDLLNDPYDEDAYTGKESYDPLFNFMIDDVNVHRFTQYISELHIKLQQLLTDNKNYPYLNLALQFYLKAFLGEGKDQLLWFITTIECLLGQKKESLTESLRSRLATIMVKTREEKKEIRKNFTDLYTFRSDIVHGNISTEIILNDHISTARFYARYTILWFIELLYYFHNETEIKQHFPTREDILQAIDMDYSTRSRFQSLLPHMPPNFPC